LLEADGQQVNSRCAAGVARRSAPTLEVLVKKFALAVLYVISVVAAFGIGANLALKNNAAAFEGQLEKMQGELALRHLLRYSELERNLEQGCKEVVLEKLKISVALESTLLASALEHQTTRDLSQYIAKQSPGLETKLTGYKSPLGNSWREPECK
jgi:hypothetical protein